MRRWYYSIPMKAMKLKAEDFCQATASRHLSLRNVVFSCFSVLWSRFQYLHHLLEISQSLPLHLHYHAKIGTDLDANFCSAHFEDGYSMPTVSACLVCGFPIEASRYYDKPWISVLAPHEIVSPFAKDCQVSRTYFVIHELCFGLCLEAQRQSVLK